MFGGQDDNAAAPQTGGVGGSQDDTLKGVSELANGPAPPAAAPQDDGQSGTFLPKPADAPESAPEPETSAPALPDDTSVPASASTDDTGSADDLMDLKQQALQQLTPLIGHLDQSPLEKFRTTMMLIQASDNQALLKDAYEAAQAIDDEKIRAQALLDVVNEINYFTQNNQKAE